MMKSGRVCKDVTAKDMELREKLRALSAVDIHLSTLCNYLAENSIVMNEDEITNQAEDAPGRIYELEVNLAEQTRLHEDAVHRLNLANQRQQDTENRVISLSGQLDRACSSLWSSPGESSSNTHIEAAEQITTRLRSGMAQMEEDYKTAVHYVKSMFSIHYFSHSSLINHALQTH